MQGVLSASPTSRLLLPSPRAELAAEAVAPGLVKPLLRAQQSRAWSLGPMAAYGLQLLLEFKILESSN